MSNTGWVCPLTSVSTISISIYFYLVYSISQLGKKWMTFSHPTIFSLIAWENLSSCSQNCLDWPLLFILLNKCEHYTRKLGEASSWDLKIYILISNFECYSWISFLLVNLVSWLLGIFQQILKLHEIIWAVVPKVALENWLVALANFFRTFCEI